jgi:hypothetical protein
MSTAAQFAANSANAQKSTGPRTGAGKNRSSQNSRGHGLTGRDLNVQPGEEDEFNDLNNSLYDEIKPEGPLEHEVFRHLIRAAWTQRCCERSLSRLLIDDCKDDRAPSYGRYTIPPDNRLMELYARRAASAFQKAMKNLRDLQTQRHLRACLPATLPDALDPQAPRLADLVFIHHAILKKRTQFTRLQTAQVLLERRQIALDKARSTPRRDLPEAA